ncbi:MAG: ABC transporter substrate-binding protein [Candidatus Dadabacteria bacterium]|nr:MAG: ABC transporter substrate-binding protein [Candidatus Dadabacteria bacterium]
MRRILVTLVACTLLAPAAWAKPIRIGITQIVEHPALDANRQGAIDRLKELGYEEGKDVVYDIQIAQGNPATANLIAKKFVGEGVDLILAIATPTAVAAAKATREIPIVISAITDPVGAKLVESLERPGRNVTGTTDLSPVAEQLKLFRTVAPKAKRIGVIYNAGEPNSVTLVNLAKKAGAELGYEIVEATVANSAGVMAAAKSLVGRADAVYVPTDNTVVSALEAVVRVCQEAKMPLVTGDTDSVKRGAVAAIAIDYYELGRQTGDMIDRILKGANPAEMPVETLKNFELHVNKNAAAAMGATLPADFVAKAAKVYE